MLFDDMVSGLLSKVEGCPRAEVSAAMRDSAAEFCQKTYCWTRWDQLQAAAGTGVVGALSMALLVVDILEAKTAAGKEVAVLAANDPALQDVRDGDLVLTFDEPSIPTLQPAPASALQLRLFRALAPGPDATDLPDALWLKHSEALKDGCLMRLFASKGAWADGNLASYHGGRFERAMTAAAASYGKNRVQPGRRLRVSAV